MNFFRFTSGQTLRPARSGRRRKMTSGTGAPEALEVRSLMTASLLTSTADSNGSATSISTRIVNGTVTTMYPTVGMVGDISGFYGSGTLIGSQYVLTAGHCAEGVANTAGRFQLGNQVYSTTQVFLHPSYNGNAIGSDSANDIAIFKLDRPVTGVIPSLISRVTPVVGQLLTLVGFGGAGSGTTGHDGSFGTKRVGTTPIDSVSSKLISWNFDNNTESNTAPGDSGGPALITVGGVTYVAGVTSGGDQANAGIGDHSFDTRVDAYAAWIDSIVGATPPVTSTIVSIVASDAAAGETIAGQTANSGLFTINRTGSTTSALTVNLTIGGTAVSGTDYTAIPTTVTIPAGSSTATISLNVRDDSLTEGNETAILSLATGTGYSIDATLRSATVTITDNEAARSNDLFANRVTLTGASVKATGTNVGATKETGEPNILGVSGGHSVWWSWSAKVSGQVTISTAGSSFDTTLGVYRGTSVSGLTLVKANDDQNTSGGVYTSRLTFNAVAGQTYQIAVDGYDGETGTIQIAVDQPAGRSGKMASPASSDRMSSGSTVPASFSPLIHGRQQNLRASQQTVSRRPQSDSRFVRTVSSSPTAFAASHAEIDGVFGNDLCLLDQN